MAVQLAPRKDPLSDWDLMPKSHARIGYDNYLSATTTSATAAALTPNTYERWRPSSGAFSVKFQLRAALSVDYFAIAAHTLSGQTITIKYATTIGGGLTDWFSIRPVNNRAIMKLFDTSITMAEIEISGTFSTAVELGVIHVGKALQMYQPIYGGHQPLPVNSKTDYLNNLSETGQWLGRNITRQGGDSSFSWRYLDPDWYRSRFQLFVDAAKSKPFFIKWRPDVYDESSYVHTTEDLSPQNMGGGHRLMSVSMRVRSHEDL